MLMKLFVTDRSGVKLTAVLWPFLLLVQMANGQQKLDCMNMGSRKRMKVDSLRYYSIELSHSQCADIDGWCFNAWTTTSSSGRLVEFDTYCTDPVKKSKWLRDVSPPGGMMVSVQYREKQYDVFRTPDKNVLVACQDRGCNNIPADYYPAILEVLTVERPVTEEQIRIMESNITSILEKAKFDAPTLPPLPPTTTPVITTAIPQYNIVVNASTRPPRIADPPPIVAEISEITMYDYNYEEFDTETIYIYLDKNGRVVKSAAAMTFRMSSTLLIATLLALTR